MCFTNKKSFTLLVVALSLVLSATANAYKNSKPSDAFRVLSYNVLVGFKVDGLSKADVDPARLKLAQQWVADKDPDVVALQELNGVSEDQLAVIAKAWGHEYTKVCYGGSGYNVGITSKTPLSEIKVHEQKGKDRPLLHGLLSAEANGIVFVVLHHSPFVTANRLREQQYILNEIEHLKRKNNRLIVLGDFNSHARVDMEKPGSDTRVMDNYFKSGLVDVTVSKGEQGLARGSAPTAILKRGYTATKRIDYILTTPALATQCIDARVINDDPETDSISDHYPVIADFDLNK